MVACIVTGCSTDAPPAESGGEPGPPAQRRTFDGLEGLQSRLTLGIAHLEDKAYEPCRILAAIVARDAPGDPAGPVLLGLAQAGKGNVDAAAAAFRDGAARAPQDPHVQFLLAESLQRSGDWEGARAAFETVVRLDPSGLAARAVLAENLLYRQDLPAAIEVLRGITAEDPANLKALLQLGEALVENGEEGNARKVYEQVEAVNPHMGSKAREHLERALRLLEDEGPAASLREFRFAGNLQRADPVFETSRLRLETVPHAGPISTLTGLPDPADGAPLKSWHGPKQSLVDFAVSDAAVIVSSGHAGPLFSLSLSSLSESPSSSSGDSSGSASNSRETATQRSWQGKQTPRSLVPIYS